jgi:hypothetical protein
MFKTHAQQCHWCSVGHILGSFLDTCWPLVGHCWDTFIKTLLIYFGRHLGHLLDTCGTLVGHFWDTCWDTFKTLLNILGDIWDTFGTLDGTLDGTLFGHDLLLALSTI